MNPSGNSTLSPTAREIERQRMIKAIEEARERLMLAAKKADLIDARLVHEFVLSAVVTVDDARAELNQWSR